MCVESENKLSINRFIFEPINSNMYLILEGKEAVIVDPHCSNEAKTLLQNHGVCKIFILLTHEHPDHTSGIHYFQKEFETTLVCQKKCAEKIANKKNNRPFLMSFILSEQDKINGTDTLSEFKDSFEIHEYSADVTFDDKYSMAWCGHIFELILTPGHTNASCCIVLDDEHLFTGDTLLGDTPVITRFPTGSLDDYNNITLPILRKLSADLKVYPGHGNMFILKDGLDISMGAK